mmetsp:Transcript_52310/g.118139  ORF Transcript_52310/g.118139 Transcript_52310/m.118139 type:complete len:133 (-) Transcript_52310:75-473(-)
MMGLARKLHDAILGSKKQKARQPVDGVLLDDDGEAMTMEGHVMHVDANGCLIMGDLDHLLGASEEEVAALPTWTLESLASLDEQTACSICQSDFQLGEELTCLPCCHHYHAACLGPWLKVSRKCPLCERSIS